MVSSKSFEQKIVKYIIEIDAPEYIKHLPHLRVDKCEYTGLGFFMSFKYVEIPFALNIPDTRGIGYKIYADIRGLEGGAGFVLSIEKGRITILEGFCHSANDWPTEIIDFEIRDL